MRHSWLALIVVLVSLIAFSEVLVQATEIQTAALTSFGDNAGASGGYGSYFGANAGGLNTSGLGNSYFGWGTGYSNTTGQDNSFFGAGAGGSNTIENINSFFGTLSDGVAGITNATAIGYRAKVARSDSLVLGGVNGINGATAETNVGIGVTNPDRQLTVEGTQAVGRLRRY